MKVGHLSEDLNRVDMMALAMPGQLPKVGSLLYVKEDFDMDVAEGSKATKVHIDPDFTLQVIANDVDGPRLKIATPVYIGTPVSQFSDKLVLAMTFNRLVEMKKKGQLYGP